MDAQITAKQPALSLTDTLRSRGRRLTRQRRIIIEVLESASRHMSATDLLEQSRRIDLTIDRATVYRTLSLLKRERLVDELDLMHLGGSEHYYERRREADHAHIGCTECGEVVELESTLLQSLAQEIEAETGFHAHSIRIEVRALCPRCRLSE